MENNSQNNYLSKNLVVTLLIIGAFSLGALAILREKITQNDQERFNVSAEGKIFAKPDIANITLSVVTDTKKEAQEAVQEGAEKMNQVIDKLGELGVDKKDIKTTQYSINPKYEYLKEVNSEVLEIDNVEYIRPTDNGKRMIVGYTLNQSVTVKIRDLEKIGDIIKESTDMGANQTGGVSFTIDDTDELKKQARSEAIKEAKEKANEIADESGLQLGKLVNVSEYEGYTPVYRNDYAYAESAIFEADSAAIPDIESGEMEVTVNVTLTYKVK